jgi:hypothetical protein
LGRAGENAGPAKYGQLPSTRLVGTSHTCVPRRDTLVPATVPVAVFALTAVQSVGAGAACAADAAPALPAIAARAQRTAVRPRFLWDRLSENG